MTAARSTRSVALAWLACAVVACGTDAVGVDACRQIEAARCKRAPACAVTLEPPYTTSGSDVDACIRYYDDACQHGIENGTAPNPTQLNACLAAVNGTGPAGNDCSIVVDPTVAPGCSWLAITAATVDAAGDGGE